MTHDHMKRLEYLRATGVGGLADPGPARERIRSLHVDRGITFETISERTGVNLETIKTHLRGWRWDSRKPVLSINRVTERKILGARFSPADGYRFPVLGIRRRLQALQSDGWNLPVMSAELDMDRRQINDMLMGRKPKYFVRSYLARRIISMYDRLECADPAARGVSAQSSKYNRTVAGRKGYAPSHCWDPDTIDDPDAFPEWTGACGSYRGVQIHRREDIPVCSACQAASSPTGFRPAQLRKLREATGMSQTTVGAAVGIDKTTLYGWESGRYEPTRDKLRAVVELLGATIEDVYGEEGS